MKRTGCRPFYWERQHGVPDCSTKEQLLLIGTLNTLLDHSSSTPGFYHLPFALCPFGVPFQKSACYVRVLLSSGGQISTFIPTIQIFDFYSIGRLPYLHFF